MHLLPTHDEVVRVLRDTGALREGHFVYPNGLHSNEYLQVPVAMRYYQHAKTLSVALSRLLRANSEIRALIPELSIVSSRGEGRARNQHDIIIEPPDPKLSPIGLERFPPCFFA